MCGVIILKFLNPIRIELCRLRRFSRCFLLRSHLTDLQISSLIQFCHSSPAHGIPVLRVLVVDLSLNRFTV